MEPLNSNSQERELHQLQQMQDNAKESCMTIFSASSLFLQVLSTMNQNPEVLNHALMNILCCQDNETFHKSSSIGSTFLDYDSEMTEKLFAEYTGIKVKQFRETLLLQPMGNVKKSIAERNHHTDQSEPSYDTHLLEKVDGNTTPDSTNISHRGGEIDQDAEQDQIKSHLLKAEFLKRILIWFLKKERFASQVDVNNVLSKPVTPHYLPKVREYVLAKPHHVIAPGSSRNSQEESYGSNDMAHNHYLEEARKKTQERNRNSKPSVMPSVRLQNTANGSTPNPKRTNQTSRSLPTSKSSCVTITVVPKADHSRNSSSFSDSKHFFCSTCHKCVFNANHDACITKLLNEVNSRKVKSYKTNNSNNRAEQKSHTQKPGRQIFSGHRFSPKKTFAVYEKTSLRSGLRWKPTGKIFTTIGLKWIPTGKLFDSCTSKVDSEPPNGSNDDITNPYECDQTLNVSADTLNLSAGPVPYLLTSGYISSGLVQNPVSLTPYVPPSKKDYEILFQPLFYEYFNPPPRAVSLDPVAVAAQELLIQPVHLHQLPLIKMYHLLLLHQQIRKFNLKSLIKVLKN
ncbi:hypothetical protein Tco_1553935 [Tanacetum coccineum]